MRNECKNININIIKIQRHHISSHSNKTKGTINSKRTQNKTIFYIKSTRSYYFVLSLTVLPNITFRLGDLSFEKGKNVSCIILLLRSVFNLPKFFFLFHLVFYFILMVLYAYKLLLFVINSTSTKEDLEVRNKNYVIHWIRFE